MNLREIAGYHGRYLVSDDGRLFSTVTGNWMAITIRSDGYTHVSLRMDGRRMSHFVHRLVALAFIGHAPTGAHEVCHVNGIRHDNRACNLRWGTAKENAADRARHGHHAKGERSVLSKLSDAQRDEIRVAYRRGNVSQRQLARQFGVGLCAVQKVLAATAHLEPKKTLA